MAGIFARARYAPAILRLFHTQLLLAWAVLLCAPSQAQTTTNISTRDTVRVMQYNLLNYGNSANRPYIKNPRLTTIVQHVQPDVIGVNEVFSQLALLDSILNALGAGWTHSAYSNLGSETQTNALFYKSALFELRSQHVISHNLRDIMGYRLRYRDGVTVPHDTVFLTVVVCHLKAAQGSSEEAERAAEAATISRYIDSLGPGNYVVMGDLNVYGSNEAAYQNLVNDADLTVRLFDPIARPGSWSGNASFADIHTQSPRTVNTLGDGGAAGGLDDRFDQILVSGPVTQDSAGVKYLTGSYKTVGQDGQHYNSSLLDAPGNTAAPQQVVQALYEMSDHLPVQADFVVHAGSTPTWISSTAGHATEPGVTVVNPIMDWLEVVPSADFGRGPVRLTLYSMQGVQVFRMTTQMGNGPIRHYIGNEIPAGLYTLFVTGAEGTQIVRKVVKL